MTHDLVLPRRVVAVDWSGRKDAAGQRRAIWLCEVDATGVVRLEAGRTRGELVQHLIDEIRTNSSVCIGLDFAFSFPAWFVREVTNGQAENLWSVVEREGEEWRRRCQPPFWGFAGTHATADSTTRPLRRRTEYAMRPIDGSSPKSVFQVNGGGTVGTGSLRGMPLLRTLREAGAAIWPFDDARLPLVVEIYPRIHTGELKKSKGDERAEYVKKLSWVLKPAIEAAAAGSDDALDALMSACAMWEHRAHLASLPVGDEVARVEGEIWNPTPHSMTVLSQ